MGADQNQIKHVIVLIILASSIAYLASTGLKALFHVPRPCELLESCPETFSFPSRHTTIAFAAATSVAFYMRRKLYGFVLFALATVVGYWRLSIGVHTLNDILGGAALGFAVGVGIYYYVRKFHGIKRRQK